MNENSEKELLKQDLKNQENPAEIKKFIEDVELMGENEDVIELAKKKLEEILAKANTIEKTSESQISQVESMSGSTGEIEKRTEGVDKQIEEVKNGTQEKINEVQNKAGIDFENRKELFSGENDLLKKMLFLKKEYDELMDIKRNDSLKKVDEEHHPDYSNIDNLLKQKTEQIHENQNEIQKRRIEQQNVDSFNTAREDFQKKETEKIQSATSLSELYKILKENGGVQGSTEHYSADQIWDRIRAYVNGEIDENKITRTGGLREKVKELKKQREVEKSSPKIEVNNPVDKINYFPGKKVSIKRSNGAIESDWNIGGEPRVINGIKVFIVYKGEAQDPRLPLKEGTLFRDQNENDLNDLNK